MAYKTPGVHVVEIPTLPPSVAEVATAVPAFVGYTEKGDGIARVSTFLEFTDAFGGPPTSRFQATLSSNKVEIVRIEATPEYLLYYSMDLYFRNGGGPCYVVSAGHYGSPLSADDFEKGLELVALEDEPTLLLFPGAVGLANELYYGVCQLALKQCGELGDRFAILDVLNGDTKAEEFRDLSSPYLAYGAAYHPFLRTILPYETSDADVTAIRDPTTKPNWEYESRLDDAPATNGIRVTYTGRGEQPPEVKILVGSSDDVTFVVDPTERTLTIRETKEADGNAIAAAWQAWIPDNDSGGFEVQANGNGTDVVQRHNFESMTPGSDEAEGVPLSTLGRGTADYNAIKTALATQFVTLPPSPAIAGIFARVDRERGVWKAPANEPVQAVSEPVLRITDNEQNDLNVDPMAGKSINAIRAFTGKGVIVWGARTLAGNDNEWRYVSVRRLFNMIEESCKKASAFAVFEPNDSNTWLKVKAMIEGFLYGLWERGALFGSSPEAAYFVHVGLGETMTTQDILEGRMNVAIGVAAVRPAEFIILKFSHHLEAA
jgi:phage tail sheath protein FI